MTEHQRLTFQCHACSETYSLYKETEGFPKLLIACPYCGAEAEVDLAIFRSTEKTTYRQASPAQSEATVLKFPDVIPTKPRMHP